MKLSPPFSLHFLLDVAESIWHRAKKFGGTVGHLYENSYLQEKACFIGHLRKIYEKHPLRDQIEDAFTKITADKWKLTVETANDTLFHSVKNPPRALAQFFKTYLKNQIEIERKEKEKILQNDFAVDMQLTEILEMNQEIQVNARELVNV